MADTQLPKVTPKTVTIVGGGIAGLMAAVESARNGLQVTVIDPAPHVGGKLQTVNENGLPLERGGELIDTDSPLYHYCKMNGIPLLSSSSSGAAKDTTEYFNAHGKVYKDVDLYDGDKKTGLAAPLLKAIREDQLHTNDVVGHDAAGKPQTRGQAIDAMSIDQYLDQKVAALKAKGTPVNADVVQIIRSSYQSEIGQPTSKISAMNLVDAVGTDPTKGFSIYGKSDESFTVKGGMKTVIDHMKADAEKAGVTFTQGTVTAVNAPGAPDAQGTIKAPSVTVQAPDGSMKTVASDYLNVTLPPDQLAKLGTQSMQHLGMKPDEIATASGMQMADITKIAMKLKPGPALDALMKTGGYFNASDKGSFQDSWLANGGTKDKDGNAAAVFYVGGNDKVDPAKCADDYVTMLRKVDPSLDKKLGHKATAADLFATGPDGKPQVMQKSGGACYVAPDKNGFKKLDGLYQGINGRAAETRVVLTGANQPMPVPAEPSAHNNITTHMTGFAGWSGVQSGVDAARTIDHAAHPEQASRTDIGVAAEANMKNPAVTKAVDQLIGQKPGHRLNANDLTDFANALQLADQSKIDELQHNLEKAGVMHNGGNTADPVSPTSAGHKPPPAPGHTH